MNEWQIAEGAEHVRAAEMMLAVAEERWRAKKMAALAAQEVYETARRVYTSARRDYVASRRDGIRRAA
jgi:hypothetical protein